MIVRYLRPRWFLFGIVLGVLICSVAGYIASQHSRYNHFVRFHNPISPVMDYYPTANELLATAMHNADPKKILVLVGGSSILRGEGQNVDELWSDRLQKMLGDHYQVLNYGFNGAGFIAFGSVAFRMLNERFAKVIFITTCEVSGKEDELDGGELYSYLFWDAYYKNLFHPDKNEKQKIASLQKKQILTEKGAEMHLMSYLDGIFYFRNLWNWVGYNVVFTLWNRNAYPHAFQARRLFQDDKLDNKMLADAVRNNPDRYKSEVDAILAMQYSQQLQSDKHFLAEQKNKLYQLYNNILSSHYHGQTVCLLQDYNPHNLSAMPSTEQAAFKTVTNETQHLLASLHYYPVQVHGFEPNDYIDYEHYMASGGYKLATQVAMAVPNVAKNNGYL